MLATVDGIVTEVRAWQEENALSAIPRTPVKSKAPEKKYSADPIAHPSTSRTPVILAVSYRVAEQLSKAPAPILATLDGIVTLVRRMQPANAELSMLVTLEGTVYVPPLPPGQQSNLSPDLVNKTPSLSVYCPLPESTVILSRAEQLANALSPMFLTPAGIATEVNFGQK
jgi:hypothetical protein